MPDCKKCAQLLTANLIGACASVGIEHGRSTVHELRLYLAARHEAEGHDA